MSAVGAGLYIQGPWIGAVPTLVDLLPGFTGVRTGAAVFYQLGLDPLAGVGAAASVGTLRFQDDFIQSLRDAADAADITALAGDGADNLEVGGTLGGVAPTNIEIEAVTSVGLHVAAAERFTLTASTVQISFATTLQWGFTTGAPTLRHQPDATAGVTGDTFTDNAQDVTSGAAPPTGGKRTSRAGDGTAGNGIAGHYLRRAGRGTGTGTDGNIAEHADPASWNAMERGWFEGNAVSVPIGNPVGGAYRYIEAGASKVRAPSGTITTYAAAEPHCRDCGRDCVLEWRNDAEGWELALCMWCVTEALGGKGIIRKVQR